jgi:hypothetical protein
MKVHIKETDSIDMTLGNNGLVLGVADTKNNHKGNLRVGKAKVTWYKGKTQDSHGVEVTWDDLIKWFEDKIPRK